MFDEQRLREQYEELSGIPLRPESLKYYGVLRTVKSLVNCANAAGIASRGKDRRPAITAMGMSVHRTQGAVAEALGLISRG